MLSLAVNVSDKMQKEYRYLRSQPMGENFDDRFKPELSPQEMLTMGVFGGKYCNDCKDEFPSSWFKDAKLSLVRDPKLNFFGVDASQSLAYWRQKGWINEEHDPRGWFQWYCRYYSGRRLQDEDQRQIKRWRQMARHIAQIKYNCKTQDFTCRPRQRQALLHWAYDSRKY